MRRLESGLGGVSVMYQQSTDTASVFPVAWRFAMPEHRMPVNCMVLVYVYING